MSLVSRQEYMETKKRELWFMVDILRDIYSDESKLDKSIKRHALLGGGMTGLEKNPDKAVDALLKEGVDRFYGEMRGIIWGYVRMKMYCYCTHILI